MFRIILRLRYIHTCCSGTSVPPSCSTGSSALQNEQLLQSLYAARPVSDTYFISRCSNRWLSFQGQTVNWIPFPLHHHSSCARSCECSANLYVSVRGWSYCVFPNYLWPRMMSVPSRLSLFFFSVEICVCCFWENKWTLHCKWITHLALKKKKNKNASCTIPLNSSAQPFRFRLVTSAVIQCRARNNLLTLFREIFHGETKAHESWLIIFYSELLAKPSCEARGHFVYYDLLSRSLIRKLWHRYSREPTPGDIELQLH